ncbi:septum formation family protein [Nocardioides sp. W7]|uniref:septum formation family protein n=1 Tax=Nocardioides sp. W7 TaxID=2931390 RepID=UPI001FD16408|nr:septum formation family protein [Nocardioides sp. W7]
MNLSTGGRAALAGLLLLALGACSGDDEQSSVFSIKPKECFLAPAEVEAQIADLDEVDCQEAHDHEAYAVVPYLLPGEEEPSDEYPGDDTLTKFADGTCAEQYRGYVGVDYLDSELFFTYLLPSPRSWQEDDRSVVCLVTAAGRKLEGSVKGTKQ